jgi:hypothetical protein
VCGGGGGDGGVFGGVLGFWVRGGSFLFLLHGLFFVLLFLGEDAGLGLALGGKGGLVAICLTE